MFWGDYHTHTTFSHGKGSVEANVLAARAAGLKAIAITDHGVSGYPKSLHPTEVGHLVEEVKRCREMYKDIEILVGVESNLISAEGDIDMPPFLEKEFDLIVCGFHKIRVPDESKAFFKFWLPNVMFTKYRKSRKIKNTDAYIKAMQRNRVSIISHPMRQFPCDLKVLGEAAKAYNVYLEINSKSCVLTHEDFETLGKTGCEFICSSDAHSPDKVGDFSAIEKFDEVFQDRSLVANWDRKPVFKTQ